MAYPPGLLKRVVQLGPILDAAGNPARGDGFVTAERSYHYDPSDVDILNDPFPVKFVNGVITFEWPRSDQPFISDGQGNAVLDFTSTLSFNFTDPEQPNLPDITFLTPGGSGPLILNADLTVTRTAGMVTAPPSEDTARRAEQAAVAAEAAAATATLLQDGISTKQIPELQALSGTNVDATAALNVLFQSFTRVTIDGDFLSTATGDDFINWDPLPNPDNPELWHPGSLQQVTLARNARLRVHGNNGPRRRGDWKFGGLLALGSTPTRGQKQITVQFPDLFTIGDWIMVCSGQRLTNISDFNYMACIRQITNKVGSLLTLDKAFARTMTDGLFRRANVRSAVVGTNVIPVADTISTVLTVGSSVQLIDYPRTAVAVNRTISAIDTTPGAKTITISGAPVTTTVTQYIARTADTGHMATPWLMKLRLAPAFNLHLEQDAWIEGRGFYDPATEPGDVAATLFMNELTLDATVTGPGHIGKSPRTATSISNTVRSVFDLGSVQDVWNTGSAGYLLNTSGASRDGHVTDNVALYKGRHGFTTNAGRNVFIQNFDANADVYAKPTGDTGITTGAQGEPEDWLIEPGEVAYMLAQALDSHRAGFNLTYVINSMHDNQGGMQVRADATRVIGKGPIDGCQSSGVVVFNYVDPLYPTILQGVKVANARGTNVDNMSINGPTIGIDCEVSGNAISDTGFGIDFGSLATGSVFHRLRVDNMSTGLRFGGTGVLIVDPKVDYATVPTLYVETGAGTTGDNQIVYVTDTDGGIGDGETRFYTPKAVGRSTAAVALSTQYAALRYLPAGLVVSMSVKVTAAAAAGGKMQLALFRTGVASATFPSTNVALVEGQVSTDVTGRQTVTFATPFDTHGGGYYWVSARVDVAGFSVTTSLLEQSAATTDADFMFDNAGSGFTRASSAGAWSAWTGLTRVDSIPTIQVGMKLR